MSKHPKPMTIKEEVEESRKIMTYLADTFFDNKCAVTLATFEGKGMVIHHLEEREGDVLSRPYKKKYGKTRYRIHYLRDLKKQFDKDPTLAERTILVQLYVHTRFDHPRNGVCKFSLEKGDRQRFCDYAMKTKTAGRGGRIKV
jgi:hypothetical protein